MSHLYKALTIPVIVLLGWLGLLLFNGQDSEAGTQLMPGVRKVENHEAVCYWTHAHGSSTCYPRAMVRWFEIQLSDRQANLEMLGLGEVDE